MIKIYEKAPMQGVSRPELCLERIWWEGVGIRNGCRNLEQMEKIHIEHMELFLIDVNEILK